MSENTPPPDEAARTLATAERIRQRVHRQSRWTAFYYVVLGLAAYATIGGHPLAKHMGKEDLLANGFLAVNILLALLLAYRLFRVELAGFQRRFYWTICVYICCFFAATLLGPVFFDDVPAWWLITGLVPAAVCFYGAYREVRR